MQEVSNNEIKLLTEAWRVFKKHQLKNQTLEPTLACRLLKEISDTDALPAYKHVGEHYSTLDQLLTILYNEPLSVAEILNGIDQNDRSANDTAIQVFFHLVYSSGVYEEDELKLAQVASYLLKIQLYKSKNINKLLVQDKAVSLRFVTYCIYQNVQTNLFLTQALKVGIDELLAIGSISLPLNSKKALASWFNHHQLNTGDYSYLSAIEFPGKVIQKLATILDIFVENILQAMSLFPHSVKWIIQNVYSSFNKETALVTVSGVNIACKAIFLIPITSAIVYPRQYGILDKEVVIDEETEENLRTIAILLSKLTLRDLHTLEKNERFVIKMCTKSRSFLEAMDSMVKGNGHYDIDTSSISIKHCCVGSIADANTLVTPRHRDLHRTYLLVISTICFNQKTNEINRK